jgi:hypothetical protein
MNPNGKLFRVIKLYLKNSKLGLNKKTGTKRFKENTSTYSKESWLKQLERKQLLLKK